MKLKLFFAALIIALPTVSVRAESAGKRRPNIVFILADDLGWRDLSNEGSTFYESPHLDRLAREGMKFTRGYATCQVCSPSRASILTGKYPPIQVVMPWFGGYLPVRMLAREGLQTWQVA